MSDDYVKLEEGDDHVLIQWGSAHRKSKIDFREPMPGEISRQMIAFMAVIVNFAVKYTLVFDRFPCFQAADHAYA